MDVLISLCFVALVGDTLLMKHLLKRGMDESHNDGHTPLVNFEFYGFSLHETLLLHSCDS